MPEQTTPAGAGRQQPRMKTRVVFSMIAFCFCSFLIGWLVMKGSPTNSLHESALSWAFMINAGILGSLGIVGAAPEILTAWRGK